MIILSMVSCFINDMNKDVYYIPTSSLTSKAFILSHFLRSPIWSKQLGNHSPSTQYHNHDQMAIWAKAGGGGGGLATEFFPCRYLVPLHRRGTGEGKMLDQSQQPLASGSPTLRVSDWLHCSI